MSEISKAEAIAYLSALSPDELQDLLLDLEEMWGLERLQVPDRHSTMGMPLYMGMPIEPDLFLLDPGPRRVLVMKALREGLGVSLKSAKALVDGAPGSLLLAGAEADRREELTRALRSLGAKVEVR